MCLDKYGMKVRIGLNWLRTGLSCGLLWTRYWILGNFSVLPLIARQRCEHRVWMCLDKYGMKVRIGLNWLRTWLSCGLLWTRYWILGNFSVLHPLCLMITEGSCNLFQILCLLNVILSTNVSVTWPSSGEDESEFCIIAPDGCHVTLKYIVERIALIQECVCKTVYRNHFESWGK
jgi:hypothetical protein